MRPRPNWKEYAKKAYRSGYGRAVKDMTNWNKASNRPPMPDIYLCILGRKDGDKVFTGMDFAWYAGDGHFFTSADSRYSTVLYWLPHPPTPNVSDKKELEFFE